jgi:hypothetical protein
MRKVVILAALVTAPSLLLQPAHGFMQCQDSEPGFLAPKATPQSLTNIVRLLPSTTLNFLKQTCDRRTRDASKLARVQLWGNYLLSQVCLSLLVTVVFFFWVPRICDA